jgi:hypothetical protein
MFRELRLGELSARRESEDRIDEDRDTLVLKEVEDTAGVLQTGLFGVLLRCRVFPR